MSENINEIYTANPITSNISTDLMYFGQSPYGAGNDAAMTYANFSAQFASSALTTNYIYIGVAGVATASQTLPTAVQGNITELGAQSQALNMNSHLINNVTDPVSAQDCATKNYVDTMATGGAALCVCATTANLNATQLGAGVGATLTNAGAQAAFSVDGVTPAVTSRVLVKDQTASQNNGVYTLTNAGSGITNWVLTRATDYNTPTEINDTGVIPVRSGTANANTGWVNTTINVAVDTTAITYVQFGASYPISLANGGTNANLTASNGGIFYSTASAGAILAGTATAAQMLMSGASGAPTWSTTTWPSTVSENDLLYASAANTISALNSGPDTWLTTSNLSVPTWQGLPVVLGFGGTNAALTASNGGIVWSNASQFQILSGTATANQLLLSGATATPAWSTTTYPATNAINTIMYASSANVLGSISAVNGGVLVSNNTGVPSMLANPSAAGRMLQSGNAAIPSWSTPTYPSASGASGLFLRSDGTNNVYSTSSIPTSAGSTAGKVLMSDGTNYVLSTPTFPSTSGSTGVILRSDGTNYVATTSTYPNTNAVNTLLYASAANVMSALATANSSVLVTDSSGVPSLSTTLPSSIAATSIQLTTPVLGTPTSGTLTNCTGYTIANLSDGAWTDFSGTIGYTGFSGSPTTTLARYKTIGKTVFFNIVMSGTSNATSFTITSMPKTAETAAYGTASLTENNGGTTTQPASWAIAASGTTLTMYNGMSSSAWTNSGTKSVNMTGFYETT